MPKRQIPAIDKSIELWQEALVSLHIMQHKNIFAKGPALNMVVASQSVTIQTMAFTKSALFVCQEVILLLIHTIWST